jgi:hypothetical protein
MLACSLARYVIVFPLSEAFLTLPPGQPAGTPALPKSRDDRLLLDLSAREKCGLAHRSWGVDLPRSLQQQRPQVRLVERAEVR